MSSETKGDVKGLDEELVGSDVPDVFKDLFNPKYGEVLMTRFIIGKDMAKFYGSPVIMAMRSGLMKAYLNSMAEHPEEQPYPLAAEITVTTLKSVMSVWAYMNLGLLGMTADLTFDEYLDVWNWLNYFDVDLHDHEILEWFDGIWGHANSDKKILVEGVTLSQAALLENIINNMIRKIGTDVVNDIVHVLMQNVKVNEGKKSSSLVLDYTLLKVSGRREWQYDILNDLYYINPRVLDDAKLLESEMKRIGFTKDEEASHRLKRTVWRNDKGGTLINLRRTVDGLKIDAADV